MQFPSSSYTDQASAVISQSVQAGSHPPFIVFQIHSSSFIIYYTIQLSASGFDQVSFSVGPSAFKPNASSRLSLLSLPTCISLSLYFPFIMPHPYIIDLTSLCMTGLQFPVDPASSQNNVFQPSHLLLKNDTPHSEKGTGQPLVVHQGHFK